jgi:hypothetical protein
MTETYIVECSRCSGLLLAGVDQKTRTCPYCGTRIDLNRVRRLSRAANAMEASEMLRKIKSQRQTNPKKPNPKKDKQKLL